MLSHLCSCFSNMFSGSLFVGWATPHVCYFYVFLCFFLFGLLTCAKSAPTVASGGVTGASGVNNMVLIGIRLSGITLHSVVIPQRSQ
jgi:hypothetical protein